jgi:hypothetical protein
MRFLPRIVERRNRLRDTPTVGEDSEIASIPDQRVERRQEGSVPILDYIHGLHPPPLGEGRVGAAG